MLIVTGTLINNLSVLMVENSERPAGQCNFPNCKSRASHGGYCIGHAKMMGTPKPVKEKKQIAKKSEKLTKETKEYKKLSEEYLKRPENQVCHIKMEGCTVKSTQVHHSAGRSGKQLTNVEDFIPSCTNCNLKVEIKNLEAKDLGVKKTRLGKINKP